MKLPKPATLLKMASKSDVKTHKVIAIAFTGSGNLVAYATNKKGSGKVSEYSFHAEEMLVQKLRRMRVVERMGKCQVLVVRMGRSGPAMAMPCKRCESILGRSPDVGMVYYTQPWGDNEINIWAL